MNEKNNYSRKCVVTNKIFPIDELIRFDYNKIENKVTLDLEKNKKGRGCYLLNNQELWTIFFSKKCLNRSFKTNLSSKDYEVLYKELEEVLWRKKQTE
ncbi:conserved hypothetical protein [Mycoplasma crocodyli MP145]|uniref:YlxR domain-containing protein n=2 Tax=Mycoplasma TaxID=2093 RepID=D5E4K6_MYCCM|nr:conserved hypothetical protein [Mycoplasma crocodyli MP145]